MTSRRPYWCPKTMTRRPCWCPKPVLWEFNSFLMQTLSVVPINLHRCWPREWKHSIELKLGNKSPTEFYKPRPPRLGYHAAWAPALAILGHSEYHSANFYRCSFPIQKIVCYHDCHRNIIPFTHPFLSSSTTALGSSSPFLMSTFLFVPSRRATSIRLVPVSVQ